MAPDYEGGSSATPEVPTDEVEVHAADFKDEGQVGPFLLRVVGPTMAATFQAEAEAGQPTALVEDEVMAADDFYFASIEMMDCCVVAKAGEALVGVALVNPFTHSLQHLAVDPAYRRRGVGRRLLETALAILKRKGADHVKIDLDTRQTEGAAFLSALGFREARGTLRMGRALA